MAWGAANRAAEIVFRAVDEKHHVRAICLFCRGIVLIGSFFLSYGLGAECSILVRSLHHGVNAAAFIRYFVRAEEKKTVESYTALAGFLICSDCG